MLDVERIEQILAWLKGRESPEPGMHALVGDWRQSPLPRGISVNLRAHAPEALGLIRIFPAMVRVIQFACGKSAAPPLAPHLCQKLSDLALGEEERWRMTARVEEVLEKIGYADVVGIYLYSGREWIAQLPGVGREKQQAFMVWADDILDRRRIVASPEEVARFSMMSRLLHSLQFAPLVTGIKDNAGDTARHAGIALSLTHSDCVQLAEGGILSLAMLAQADWSTLVRIFSGDYKAILRCDLCLGRHNLALGMCVPAEWRTGRARRAYMH